MKTERIPVPTSRVVQISRKVEVAADAEAEAKPTRREIEVLMNQAKAVILTVDFQQ